MCNGSRYIVKKRIIESHEKRIQGFHSTWVEIRTQDAVEKVDVVVVAEEVVAEVPMRPYLGRHLK